MNSGAARWGALLAAQCACGAAIEIHAGSAFCAHRISHCGNKQGCSVHSHTHQHEFAPAQCRPKTLVPCGLIP